MKNSASHATAILGLQQAVTFVASFAIHAIAGRVLGPEEYGLFSITVAVVSIVVFSALLGLPHAVSKVLAETGQLTTGVLWRGFWAQLVLALTISGLLYLLADNIAFHLGEPHLAPLLRIASISIPFSGAAFLLLFSLNGLGEFGKQAVGQSTITIFRLIATAAFLALGLGLDGAIWALTIGAVTTFVFVALLCWSIPRYPGTEGGNLFAFAAKFNTTFVLLTVWYYIDPILMEYLGTGPDEVGLFTAAATLASGPEAIFVPLLLVLFPSIARSISIGAVSDVNFYLRKSIFYVAAIMCPLVVGSALISEDLLATFFGQDYVQIHAIVAPLVAGGFFRVMFELGDTHIRASGNATLSICVAATILVVHFMSAFILVPRFGVAGMVTSVVASSLVGALLTMFFLLRTLPLRINWISLLSIIASSIAAFLPLLLVDLDGIWAILATVPCLMLYLVFLVMFGELNREDLNRAMRVVRMIRSSNNKAL